MDDYPRNLQEFDARFGTENACRNYLVKLRWPEGFICPHCGETKAWVVREVLWQAVMVEPRTYRMIVDQAKPDQSSAPKPPLVGVT